MGLGFRAYPKVSPQTGTSKTFKSGRQIHKALSLCKTTQARCLQTGVDLELEGLGFRI